MHVWFDEDGDFLEVSAEERNGFFKDVGNGIFERVDENGDTIGFAVLNVRGRSEEDIEVPFTAKFRETTTA